MVLAVKLAVCAGARQMTYRRPRGRALQEGHARHRHGCHAARVVCFVSLVQHSESVTPELPAQNANPRTAGTGYKGPWQCSPPAPRWPHQPLASASDRLGADFARRATQE